MCATVCVLGTCKAGDLCCVEEFFTSANVSMMPVGAIVRNDTCRVSAGWKETRLTHAIQVGLPASRTVGALTAGFSVRKSGRGGYPFMPSNPWYKAAEANLTHGIAQAVGCSSACPDQRVLCSRSTPVGLPLSLSALLQLRVHTAANISPWNDAHAGISLRYSLNVDEAGLALVCARTFVCMGSCVPSLSSSFSPSTGRSFCHFNTPYYRFLASR